MDRPGGTPDDRPAAAGGGNDTEYDGIELFAALCDYLDQLYGGAGFDRLLAPDRDALAEVVQRTRGRPERDR